MTHTTYHDTHAQHDTNSSQINQVVEDTFNTDYSCMYTNLYIQNTYVYIQHTYTYTHTCVCSYLKSTIISTRTITLYME